MPELSEPRRETRTIIPKGDLSAIVRPSQPAADLQRGDFSDPDPFDFSAFETPSGTLLSWFGQAPVEGLASFDLYCVDKGSEGTKIERLNQEPLPLNGSFVDTRDRSLVRSIGDPFAGLLDTSDNGLSLSDPVFFDSAFALLRTFRASPFMSLGPPVATVFAPSERYCLVGTYLTGDEGPALPVNAQKRTWTPRQKTIVLEKITQALREVRDRKLVRTIRPNPDNIDFFGLGGQITVMGDCGELGPNGLTSPTGKAEGGARGFKSSIVLNGNYVLAASGEEMVALVLHELVHAVQNLSFINTGPDLNLVDATTGRVAREAQAYEVVWDQIVAGDIILLPRLRCWEIAKSVRGITDVFVRLAGLATAGGGLNAGQKRAVRDLRAQVRRLLQKYVTFLKTLPANDKSCVYRSSTGSEEPLLSVVQRLLREVFK